jgi:hypothetical protein
MLGFHMADDGFERGAAFHLAAQGLGGAARLAG